MTEGFPDDYNRLLFPTIDKVIRVAKAIGRFLPVHLLSPVSDHEFKHPFDELYTGEPTQEVAIVERGVEYE